MTDSYDLVVKKSAERELRALPKQDLRRVTERLQGLSHNPVHQAAKSSPEMISIGFGKVAAHAY